MRCPKCGSSNVQFVTNNKTTSPSIASGVCGYLILGPLGLLCALCGVSNTHEEYWLCKECATKFSEKNSLEAKEKKVEDKIKNLSYSVSNMEKRIETLEVKKNKVLGNDATRYASLIQEVGDTYEEAKNVLDDKKKQYKENEKEVLQAEGKLMVIKYLKWLWAVIGLLVAFLTYSEEKPYIAFICVIVAVALWILSDKLYEKKLFAVESSATVRMKQLKVEKEIVSYYVQQYKLRQDIERKNKKIDNLYQSKKGL